MPGRSNVSSGLSVHVAYDFIGLRLINNHLRAACVGHFIFTYSNTRTAKQKNCEMKSEEWRKRKPAKRFVMRFCVFACSLVRPVVCQVPLSCSSDKFAAYSSLSSSSTLREQLLHSLHIFRSLFLSFSFSPFFSFHCEGSRAVLAKFRALIYVVGLGFPCTPWAFRCCSACNDVICANCPFNEHRLLPHD